MKLVEKLEYLASKSDAVKNHFNAAPDVACSLHIENIRGCWLMCYEFEEKLTLHKKSKKVLRCAMFLSFEEAVDEMVELVNNIVKP